MLLEQLQTLPTTYTKTVFALTSLQRSCLELDALFNYMTVYKPRIDNYFSDPPDNSTYITTPLAQCIGAFTTIPGVAQQLWSARLPFWFLRPTFVFDLENILSVVTLEEPIFEVPDTHADGTPPIIYSGSSTEEKIAAIHFSAKQNPWYRDPFETLARSAPPTAPPASLAKEGFPVASTSRQVARPNNERSHYKPCMSQFTSSLSRLITLNFTDTSKLPVKGPVPVTGPTKSERNKFEVLTVAAMPPSIATWADALARVDQSVTPFTSNLGDRRYVFPEAALFANTTPEQQRKYLHHWCLLRDGFAYLLSQPEHSQLLSAQQWRDILNGLVTKRGHSQSRSHRRSTELEDLIRPALEACNVTSVEGFPVAPESLREFSLTQTREILWEVAETGFRFEFCALDRRASMKDRLDDVKGCFAGGMLLGAPLEMSKRGFAAEKIEQRHRYFLRAATLMLDWNTRSLRPPVLSCGFLDHSNWTLSQMEGLEVAVCQFYTQAFWEHFGRAAVVPLRLDHDVEKEEGEL
ncbi:hypothetical protein GGX14DRAFT_380211 [Mycena pura]|uniref:Uncharacterized protein n=1 Tax=Mycena pura TaxID=153505 RepID=A0AAD6UUG2_9AGAR|nr:hypothetical protein GGX14DRAFT_380211 [Mycena pura]